MNDEQKYAIGKEVPGRLNGGPGMAEEGLTPNKETGRVMSKHEEIWHAINRLESAVDRLDAFNEELSGGGQDVPPREADGTPPLIDTLEIAPGRIHDTASRVEEARNILRHKLYGEG